MYIRDSETINIQFTKHATVRMSQRNISAEAVEAAIVYGREVFTRGATIYALGHKDVARAQLLGVSIKAYEGVQVVAASDGSVVTVYRNKNLRSLRVGSKRRVGSINRCPR
jgi:Domain of unknown function (DUF4258)